EISEIGEGFRADATAESLLIAAGLATQALAAYNKRVTWLIDRQADEVQTIVRMLQRTIVGITGENTRSGQRLQQIGQDLEKSGAIKDLSGLKEHLGECLHNLQEETSKQKSEADSTIQRLQVEIERSKASASYPAGGE